MRYGVLGLFVVIWAVAALVTANVGTTAASESDFGQFGDSVFAAEEITVDRPLDGSSNPLSVANSYFNSAKNTVSYMWRSATLSSEIWEGWAQPIRWAILVVQLPMLLLLLLELAKVISGYIPFT